MRWPHFLAQTVYRLLDRFGSRNICFRFSKHRKSAMDVCNRINLALTKNSAILRSIQLGIHYPAVSWKRWNGITADINMFGLWVLCIHSMKIMCVFHPKYCLLSNLHLVVFSIYSWSHSAPNIIETTEPIRTKFCTVIKTTKNTL